GVVVMVSGAAPYIERVDIEMVPGPAAAVEVQPSGVRLALGQRLKLSAASQSAFGDPREDSFTWASSDPAVVGIDAMGRISAVAPGSVTITASAGGVVGTARVEVVPDQ